MEHRLSEHFSVEEFTRSQTAARHGLAVDLPPGSREYRAASRLCATVLEPLRRELGPVTVTSGYRPPRLNRLVGGSPRSAHMRGLAADIVLGLPLFEAARHIQQGNLPFDQLIYEFGRWIHLAAPPPGEAPARMVLTAYHDPEAGRTRYLPGVRSMASCTPNREE
jgi:hypothetical protein